MNIPFADWLTNHARQLSLAVALAAAAAALGWFALRDYTILEVNGARIPLSRFTVNYRAAARFRANAFQTYLRDASSSAPAADPLDERAFKAAVLTQLVDAALVEQGAREKAGADLDGLVAARVDRYTTDANLATASRALYGVSVADFTREVLVPQAMSDILRGRLFLENKSFNDWLTETRRAAKVTVFSDEFAWDGTRIAPK